MYTATPVLDPIVLFLLDASTEPAVKLSPRPCNRAPLLRVDFLGTRIHTVNARFMHTFSDITSLLWMHYRIIALHCRLCTSYQDMKTVAALFI